MVQWWWNSLNAEDSPAWLYDRYVQRNIIWIFGQIQLIWIKEIGSLCTMCNAHSKARRASPRTPRRAPSKWKLWRTQVDINNLPQHQHALIKPQCLPIRWEMVIILKFFEFWRVHSDHLVEADAGNQLQEVHRLTVDRSQSLFYFVPQEKWFSQTSWLV